MPGQFHHATAPASDAPLPVLARKKRLVVMVPGIVQTTKLWVSLTNRLRKESGYTESEADWMAFDNEVGPFSFGTADNIARRLRAQIEQQWIKHGGYDDVVLIGHSLGGVMARQAYLLACGGDPRDGRTSEWGTRVIRIVLFAAINRGIRDHTMPRRTVIWLLKRLPLPHLVSEDLLRGSDFIANLRINWIRHFAKLESQTERKTPLVVQFVGDRDGVVAASDSDDLLAFKARPFDIPDADHGDLYRIDKAKDPEGRYAMIRRAFVAPPENIPVSAIQSSPKHSNIVFLLHGIMSANIVEWIADLESKLASRPNVKVINPEYPYVSPFRFAVPSIRKRNIRFFQDLYSNVLAHHPTAEFNFIGHSNGTYILGQSLKHIPGMRFKNVVLAGSVLPIDYPWVERIQTLQVQSIRNDRANRDVPVGLLCSALRYGLFMRDIGTGGYEGFSGASTKEVAYYPGGHGEALRRDNLDNLIDFALAGECRTLGDKLVRKLGFFRLASRAMPFLTWLVLLLLVFLSFNWIFEHGQFHLFRLLLLSLGAFAVAALADIL
jgi:pimeloyl-ACP methyl ester carboxylesterase